RLRSASAGRATAAARLHEVPAAPAGADATASRDRLAARQDRLRASDPDLVERVCAADAGRSSRLLAHHAAVSAQAAIGSAGGTVQVAAIQSCPLAETVRREFELNPLNSPVLSGASPRGPLAAVHLPGLAVTASVLLALLLQWLIAALYADLIGTGARAPHSAGAEVPISYLCTAATTIATAWYCGRRSGPSRVVLVLHLIAVIIPMQALVVAQFEFARPAFADAVALAILGTLLLAGATPELTMKQPGTLARVGVVLLCLLLSLYVYGALVAQGGIGRLNFDLSKVYEVRDEFLEGLAPLLGYLVPWQGLVNNPALMLAAMKRRSLLLGLLALLL